MFFFLRALRKINKIWGVKETVFVTANEFSPFFTPLSFS